MSIEFHLDHGVDFIIATDNGSVDNTRSILEQYERKGVLFLIDEPAQNYSQQAWVNRMGEIALYQYHANIIFHCDADEFWYPYSGSLKNELLLRSDIDVLKVDVINFLLKHSTGMEEFPIDTKYAVVNPFYSNNIKNDSLSKSLYLFQYDRKVIYRTDKGYLQVNQGNHNIVKDNSPHFDENYSFDIIICHFPIRGFNHFTKKIINGGEAYEKNLSLGKNVGWQWKRWYEAYKINQLNEEYKRLTLASEELKVYMKSGVIKDWSKYQNKISSYL